MTDVFKAIAGSVAVVVTLLAAPTAHDSIKSASALQPKPTQAKAVKSDPKPAAVTPAPAEVKAAKQPQPEQQPAQAAPQQPTPARWAVSVSPHGRVSTAQINEVLGILQDKGLTKQGAAYLTGNFIAESYLLPCAAERGDGGAAWGLGQWHPNRRFDMPCELKAQIDWAIDIEMPRDHAKGGGHNLHGLLYDPAAGEADFALGFKRWERYGIEGNRIQYGAAIYAQL